MYVVGFLREGVHHEDEKQSLFSFSSLLLARVPSDFVLVLDCVGAPDHGMLELDHVWDF
jgi:hypothetical protein